LEFNYLYLFFTVIEALIKEYWLIFFVIIGAFILFFFNNKKN